MKSLGIDKIPEELTPEKFVNFDDTVAATEPFLSDESILAMVREVEKLDEVESDEEDGDNTIEVHKKWLENPTVIELISATETLMDFSFHGRGATLHDENFSFSRKLIIRKFEASFN